MFYIELRNKKTKIVNHRSGHVPMKGISREELFDDFSNRPENYDVFIQADGHELHHIENQFTNIRQSTKRVVRWTGEDARFILLNL
jgi:hypothetical protein